MWVCICHALTDSDIETAETEGAKNEYEVFSHYGVRPQCGRCVPTVKCLMKCQNKACEKIVELQAKNEVETQVVQSPSPEERKASSF